jgi:translation elongation factor EF-G
MMIVLFSLGKLYAVFGKRQGRVISAENAHGFGGQFKVLATLPVMESFHLARELRTQTSGLASPQLVFSHWEVNIFSYLAINISHHIIYYLLLFICQLFFCFV